VWGAGGELGPPRGGKEGGMGETLKRNGHPRASPGSLECSSIDKTGRTLVGKGTSLCLVLGVVIAQSKKRV